MGVINFHLRHLHCNKKISTLDAHQEEDEGIWSFELTCHVVYNRMISEGRKRAKLKML